MTPEQRPENMFGATMIDRTPMPSCCALTSSHICCALRPCLDNDVSTAPTVSFSRAFGDFGSMAAQRTWPDDRKTKFPSAACIVRVAFPMGDTKAWLAARPCPGSKEFERSAQQLTKYDMMESIVAAAVLDRAIV